MSKRARTRARIRRLRDPAIAAGFKLWDRTLSRPVARLYHYDLIYKTGNFRSTEWLGIPIWQNVLDLWTLQETLAELKPALIIETGTDHGGSAVFYAHLMDLLNYDGKVMTIDIVDEARYSHPRVEYVVGSSTDPEIVARAEAAAAEASGPVMVILDSDHSHDHVAAELELYAPLVTRGSFLLSQDGIIDQLWVFKDSRPGPLHANGRFLARHPEFTYDEARNRRFRLTHHPLGWMRRDA